MNKTSIPWTDITWNPIIGCHKISPGCLNCYAERMANRLSYVEMTKERYGQVITDGKWNGETNCDYDVMHQPLQWKKPRKIFVGSMTDIFFHRNKEDLHHLFAIMAVCHQHSFQVLTKRPGEANIFMNETGTGDAVKDIIKANYKFIRCDPEFKWEWPPRNVWLGVTICNQDEASHHIPILLDTPAAVRYISMEPMLAKVDLEYLPLSGGYASLNILNGLTGICTDPAKGTTQHFKRGLDWVIVGGETGPGARPMYPEGADAVYRACQRHNTPFFFKSWGTYFPNDIIGRWNRIGEFNNVKQFPK